MQLPRRDEILSQQRPKFIFRGDVEGYDVFPRQRLSTGEQTIYPLSRIV